jgi:D-amino-acid dehydrogenase
MVVVTAAAYLQRDGHEVVLIDPDPPGQGASFGNAGCFNPSSVVPIAGPDTLKQVPPASRNKRRRSGPSSDRASRL